MIREADPLVEWGSFGPPRHPDGTPVITEWLDARLTPLERLLYSGDALTTRLANRAYWLTDGASVDGWEPEDFVAYALEQAARYPAERSSSVYSTWMRQEISRRRTRTDRVVLDDLYDDHGNLVADPEDVGFVPTRLPVEVVDWLYVHLPFASAHAVKICAERGLTPAQAAATVGIDRKTVARALETLRKAMQ